MEELIFMMAKNGIKLNLKKNFVAMISIMTFYSSMMGIFV